MAPARSAHPVISDERFVREFGSFLCGVRHGLVPEGSRPGTCSTRATPLTAGYGECRSCDQTRRRASEDGLGFPIHEIAFLTYAVEGSGGVSGAHDHQYLLVTSANFSKSAEQLNSELGIRIDDPILTQNVEAQVRALEPLLYERVPH